MNSFCTANTTTGCGNGICSLDESTCYCDVGYIHDLTWIKCPNCYLPSAFRTPMCIVLLLASFLVGCFILYQSKGLTKTPFRLCISSSIICFLVSFMSISELLENTPGPFTTFFAALYLLILIGYTLPLFLFSIISPVLDMSRKTLLKRKIETILKILASFQIILCIITWTLFLIYQDDYSIWNTIYWTYSIVQAIYTLILYLLMRYWFMELITHLNTIIASVGSNDTKMKKYKSSLTKTVTGLKVTLIPICMNLVTFSLVYFTIGCIPYLYIIFFCIYLSPNFVCLAFVFFTKTNKQTSENTSTISSSRDVL